MSVFTPGQGKCLCWGPGWQEKGGPAFLQASQPKGADGATPTHKLQPRYSARAASWEGLGSAAAGHPFHPRFPWTGVPGSPAGAKPCSLQVPWDKQRTSGTLPQAVFREVALGLGCPLYPPWLGGLSRRCQACQEHPAAAPHSGIHSFNLQRALRFLARQGNSLLAFPEACFGLNSATSPK